MGDTSRPNALQPQPGNALRALSDILRQRFVLRDLLWCGVCDEPIQPILVQPLARYYACTNRACPLPAMPAKILENRVWSQFVRLQGDVAHGVPREPRHEMMCQVLDRVVMGPGMTRFQM